MTCIHSIHPYLTLTVHLTFNLIDFYSILFRFSYCFNVLLSIFSFISSLGWSEQSRLTDIIHPYLTLTRPSNLQHGLSHSTFSILFYFTFTFSFSVLFHFQFHFQFQFQSQFSILQFYLQSQFRFYFNFLFSIFQFQSGWSLENRLTDGWMPSRVRSEQSREDRQSRSMSKYFSLYSTLHTESESESD